MPEDLKRFTSRKELARLFHAISNYIIIRGRQREREEGGGRKGNGGMSSTRECSEIESSVLCGTSYSSQRNILLRVPH